MDEHFEHHVAAMNPHVYMTLLHADELVSRQKTMRKSPQSLLFQKERLLSKGVFDQAHARQELELLLSKQMQQSQAMQLDRKASHTLVMHTWLATLLDNPEAYANWWPGKTAVQHALLVAENNFVPGTFADVQHYVHINRDISPDALLTAIAAAHDAEHLRLLRVSLDQQGALLRHCQSTTDANVIHHVRQHLQHLYNDELHHLVSLHHQDLHNWHTESFTF